MRSVRSACFLALLGALRCLAEEAPPAPSDSQEQMLEAFPVRPEIPQEEGFQLRGGSDYKIGKQDLLEIKVFDLDELNQTVRVADDGSITVPLLGRLSVAGLSKGDLEALIARLLEARYIRDPQVTIFIKEYESKKVAVSGAVRKPGTYEMLGEKTLLEMISVAGGLDQNLGREIIIFRRDEGGTARRLSIDLDRLVYDADPELNVTVLPSDIIYVPTVETVRIFVSGAVKNPNLYEIPRAEPITVLKAITLAGGTTDRASERHVQVIRTDLAGGRVTIPVDLRKVKKGKAPDPILEKDDVVLVPEAFF